MEAKKTPAGPAGGKNVFSNISDALANEITEEPLFWPRSILVRILRHSVLH